MMIAAAASSLPTSVSDSAGSPVSEFYRDRSIFVTGATGFIGKVLVEKLLRSCSDIRSIYILVRPKRGRGAEERREQLLSAKIFDVMRKKQPHLFQKVIAMEGDIAQPELGLSATDQETLKSQVSVVFNSAAAVRFDEPLKVAVAMNIEGTVRLVELCRDMPHLVAFIHVSTAYSNCDRRDIKEDFYDPPYDPEQFVNTIKFLDDAILATITPKILGKHPNTYTLTKALSESLLLKIAKDLPVSIVRPSIVTGSLREPLPGWVDNVNGPTGLMVASAKGLLRTVLCCKELVADVIPVDLCINLMLAVAWKTANTTKPPPLPKIYQIVSGAQNPIRWQDAENNFNKIYVEMPCRGIFWYPHVYFTSSRLISNVCAVFQQDIPALLFDAGVRLSRRKPFMVAIQKRLKKALSAVDFFRTHEWNFTDTNVQNLLKELSPEDCQTFNFDITLVAWKEYIRIYYNGSRMFVLKEGPEIEEKSRTHLRRLHIVHRIVQIVFVVLCCWLVAPQSMKLLESVLR